MPFSLQVQHFRTGRNNVRQLIKETPYIRISVRGEGVLYAQSGSVWSESGDEMKDVPQWFWEQYERVAPEKRKKIGLEPPRKKAA